MICVNKTIFIYYSNSDSLMYSRFNELYFLNLLNWFDAFKKYIYNDKKNWLSLMKKMAILIKYARNETYLKIIKNNTELKKKYIAIFHDINNNYNYTHFHIPELLNSLENI